MPLGASSLRSWWSSTISAFAMWRAASAAKRIISTAPIAKLGATSTLAEARSPPLPPYRLPLGRAYPLQLAQVEAGGADHGVHARANARHRVLQRGLADG